MKHKLVMLGYNIFEKISRTEDEGYTIEITLENGQTRTSMSFMLPNHAINYGLSNLVDLKLEEMYRIMIESIVG